MQKQTTLCTGVDIVVFFYIYFYSFFTTIATVPCILWVFYVCALAERTEKETNYVQRFV